MANELDMVRAEITAKELNDERIRRVKQHRKDLDAVLQHLKAGHASPDVDLAITKLDSPDPVFAGMPLKNLGTPTPYPLSYDPSSAEVYPTADGLKL